MSLASISKYLKGGLGKVSSWALANPGKASQFGMMGAGALAGGMTGGWSGALVGAGLGYGLNKRGYGSYKTQRGGGLYQRAIGKVSRGIMRSGLGEQAIGLAPLNRWSKPIVSARSGASIQDQVTRSFGNRRNLGSKILAARGIGQGMALGAGLGGGMLVSGVGRAFGGIGGSNYGRNGSSPYGVSFSGTGNGTMRR